MTASPETKLAAPTFILSVTSLVITGIVSAVTVHNTSEQKQKEIEIQKLKNDADRQTSRGELVFKNIGPLNSQNENEQKLAVAALVYTLGQEEAKKFLMTVQTVGSGSVKDIARNARDEISKAELQRSANINLWQGTWHYSFVGKHSTTQSGKLRFAFNPDGTARGEFQAEPPSSLQGKITTASLSDEGSVLSGTWTNSANQSGRFSFQLKNSESSPESSAPPTFSGTYSMGTAPPLAESPNAWSGTKEKD